MLTYRIHVVVERFAERLFCFRHTKSGFSISTGVEVASPLVVRPGVSAVRQPWECLVESILVDFHHPNY